MTQEEIRYVADIIRNSVSALDAGHALGIHTDYKGRCKCFIHGGEHMNMKLYDENRGYYCFVCHAYGNVIDLVKNYTHCSFMDAIEWLNESFNIGITIRPKDDPYERRRRAIQRMRQKEKENANGSHS